MKINIVLPISVLGIVTALILSSCGPTPRGSSFVEMSCDQGVIVLNHANGEASSPGTNGTLTLYLSGPSLFSVMNQDEDDSFSLFLYLAEDGNQINLHIDDALLYVNGIAQTVIVNADEPSNFASWYASADNDALKSLRIIGYDGKEGNPFEKEFKAIQSVNPHVLCVDHDEGNSVQEEVFDKYKPLVFMMNSEPREPSNQHILARVDLSETRVLMLEDINPETAELLAGKAMPNLYRLIFSDSPDSDKLLNAVPHVKAITFGELEKIPDLSQLEDLEELYLASKMNDMAIDLTQLPTPEALRILSLHENSTVVGTDKLTNLEYLNPGAVELSDEELAAMLSRHPTLVFLDLIYATLESLEPLKDATQLEGIVLGKFMEGSESDYAPLGSLKQLRYIGLPNDLGEDPEALAAIEKVCPRAIIYHHDKFCLGSGWLVAFPPLFLFILLLKRIHSKSSKGA